MHAIIFGFQIFVDSPFLLKQSRARVESYDRINFKLQKSLLLLLTVLRSLSSHVRATIHPFIPITCMLSLAISNLNTKKNILEQQN